MKAPSQCLRLLRAPRAQVFAPLLLALALSSLGCKKTSEAAEQPAEQQVVAVQTEPVQVQDVPRTLRLSGNLRGDRETELAANASGRR